MARRNQIEAGERREVTRRTGVDQFPGWGGMFLVGDPASVPLNRVRHAENVRFNGGIITERPGVSVFNAEPLDDIGASIKALQDFQISSRKIYITNDGCPDISTTLGSSLNWFDSEDQTRTSSGIYYPDATSTGSTAVLDGKLYIGVDYTLKAFTLLKTAYGVQGGIAVSGIEQAEIVTDFTGIGKITTLGSAFGLLFIGLDNGSIWTFDGTTRRQDATGLQVPSVFCIFRDKLVAGFSDASGDILYRSSGSSPGSWTTVAAAINAWQMVSAWDKLFITGKGVDLWSFDGAAVASDHSLAATSELWGLEFFPAVNKLYFGYKAAGVGTHAKLGTRTQGGVFVDAYHDLTVDVPGGTIPRVIREYRGNLVVGVDTGTNIAVSEGQDTTQFHVYQSGLLVGDFRGMTVF